MKTRAQRGRSSEVIEKEDLGRLSRIARADLRRFLERRPEYEDRFLCSALCQGAGLHYVDVALGKRRPNGVKDFDVWSFFAAIPEERFPADRRNVHVDFGPSKFGAWRHEFPRWHHFAGRRVDLLMRALPVPPSADRIEAVRAWLARGGRRAHACSLGRVSCSSTRAGIGDGSSGP